ncbi:hypothetical protein GCM10027299_39420 [Larkinella ripae]
MPQDVNLAHLCHVADALANLPEKFVFVGGATVQLYATDPAAAEPRPTQDIDVVVALVRYSDTTELEQKLVQLGFSNDILSGVICRYIYQNIIVDVMPTESSSLGFSNKWYPEGVEQARPYEIDADHTVFIFTAPYFLASKLEAFKSHRHGHDIRGNSDFEDMIYIFDNREEVAGEIKKSPDSVRLYLVDELKKLLAHPSIYEGISVHLEPATSSLRTQRILKIWDEITR